MTVKFSVSASDNVMQDIREKYVSLFTTLLDADDELELLSADPDKAQPPIIVPSMIPNNVYNPRSMYQLVVP